MSPWRGGRTQVEGTMGAAGTPREFNANTARSVYGTCEQLTFERNDRQTKRTKTENTERRALF